jgi:GH35 family endo-1,4-beta-xylanase
MRIRFVPLVCIATLASFTTTLSAQTSLTASSLAYDSLGTSSTTLSATGYLGTYVTIPAGGATVNFDVNATGSSGHMNLVIANSTFGFNLTGGSATDYTTQNVTLPAGTYFVRAERDYDNNQNQNFTLNNLSVNTIAGSPATFNNAATAANALAAANTYISNFREAPLNVTINGVASGTPVEIKEMNSLFKWGTAVPDPLTTYITPGSQYEAILKKDFNSVTPENAGKWSESNTTSQLNNLDTLTAFAAQNNIRVRMQGVVWGSQQPSNINTDFTNARSSNPTTAANAKAAITSALNSRISSYIAGTNSITHVPRAAEFSELEVYNESYHTGAGASASTGDNYWQVMGGSTAGGATWTASLYNQAQSAASSVGTNPALFTNDYNVLNNNSDLYGQWYSQHVQSIRAAGGAIGGIGTEWYNSPGVGTSGSQVDPSRAYATWENLAAQGVPLEVSEFGESTGNESDISNGLTTAMTLAFGMPTMTGFTLWNAYNDGNLFSGSAGSYLYDSSYNITGAGQAYESLLSTYTTDDTSTTNPGGSVTLPGSAFYGDYDAIINGKTYPFTFNAATNNFVINVPEPGSLIFCLTSFLLVLRRRRAA